VGVCSCSEKIAVSPDAGVTFEHRCEASGGAQFWDAGRQSWRERICIVGVGSCAAPDLDPETCQRGKPSPTSRGSHTWIGHGLIVAARSRG
jgi:hypothetical protein